MTIAAASQTSAIFSTLPLLALLLFVIAVFRWNRRSKAVTKRQLDQLEQQLKIIRNEILLVTTNAVPGERTVRTIGYVEALSEAEAASDWEYRLAEKQALLDLDAPGNCHGGQCHCGASQEQCPL
jgi:hypothetical protein